MYDKDDAHCNAHRYYKMRQKGHSRVYGEDQRPLAIAEGTKIVERSYELAVVRCSRLDISIELLIGAVAFVLFSPLAISEERQGRISVDILLRA